MPVGTEAFIPTVGKRGAAIIEDARVVLAASAANAAITTTCAVIG